MEAREILLMKRALILFLLIASSLFGVEFYGLGEDLLPKKDDHLLETWATVRFVFDGDTVEVDIDGTRERVRYIGIDSPERPRKHKKGECFWEEAMQANFDAVFGKDVRLVRDVSNRDKFGRLLRYVYLQDGQLLNTFLVQEGYAKARSYPPDILKQGALIAAEREASKNNNGLWNACEND